MTTTNFNKKPYFDDFDPAKGFVKVLFRPSFALQARELNQLQSILQDQVATVTNGVFKNKSAIVGGQLTIDDEVYCVTIDNDDAIALNPHLVVNQKANIGQNEIYVVHYIRSNSALQQKAKLYFKVISNGDLNKDEKLITFNNKLQFNRQDNTEFTTATLAHIDKGRFFIEQYHVNVDEQTIAVVDDNSVIGDVEYSIGIQYTDRIITAEQDSTLYDNAINSNNYSAPGAHRYKIETVLTSYRHGDEIPDNYIEISRYNVKKNEVNKKYDPYNDDLMQTLARRLYDQSGDYTVKPYIPSLLAERNNIRGDIKPNTHYRVNDYVTYKGKNYLCIIGGTTLGDVSSIEVFNNNSVISSIGTTQWVQVAETLTNNGLDSESDSDNLVVKIGTGKAYVKGWELEHISPTNLIIEHPKNTRALNNQTLTTNYGASVIINDFNGSFNMLDSFDFLDIENKVVATGKIVDVKKNSNGRSTLYFIDFDVKGTNPLTTIVKLKSSKFDVSVTHNTIKFPRDNFDVLSDVDGKTTIRMSNFNVEGIKKGDLFLSGGKFITVNRTISTDTIVFSKKLNDNELTTLQRAIVPFANLNSGSFIFRTASPFIDSISDLQTTISETFNGTLANKKATVTTKKGYFANTEIDENYTLFVANKLLPPSAYKVTATNNNQSLVIEIIDQSVNDGQFTLITSVTTRSSDEINAIKTKTLTSNLSTVKVKKVDGDVVIKLPHVDVVRLMQVKLKETGEDLTKTFYLFDDGQRNTHYDYATITIPNSSIADGKEVIVEYLYYKHSADGICFSANSYSDDYPAYFGNTLLTGCLDFRESVEVKAKTLPKRGAVVSYNANELLSSSYKVILNKNGDFKSIFGGSNVYNALTFPETPSDAMVLYTLKVLPRNNYTQQPKDLIDLTIVDNRRYTMRDIGKIENRVEKLEYYTSLTMQELKTSSLEVLDSNGNNRFKNGFVVDNYKNNVLGNVRSPLFKSSINDEEEFLTTRIATNSNKLGVTKKENIAVRDNLAMLPYSEVEFVSQPLGTNICNINPFAVFTFIGSMNFYPQSDVWKEEQQAPDLIIQKEGNYNDLAQLTGTTWGDINSVTTSESVVIGQSTQKNQWLHVSSTEVQKKQWQPPQNDPNATWNVTGNQPTKTGGWRGGDAWGVNETVTTTTTKTTDTTTHSQTGKVTTIEERIDYEDGGTRVIGNEPIAWMRERNIIVSSKQLKPSTKFKVLFDGIDVTKRCIGGDIITIADPDKEIYNRFKDIQPFFYNECKNEEVKKCFTFGDRSCDIIEKGIAIFGNGYYGVSQQVMYINGNTVLYAVRNPLYKKNLSGANVSLYANEFIKSNVSVTIETKNSISTDKSGNLSFLFKLPNDNLLRFKCGERSLSIVEDTSNESSMTKSTTSGLYFAQGTLVTNQKTVYAVRNGELSTSQIVREWQTQESQINTHYDVKYESWADPLAQTFEVSEKDGVFITSVDVYFSSKDDNIPVTCEIRPVEAGYPSKGVISGSKKTLYPHEVNISEKKVEIETETGTIRVNASNRPTTFTFDYPIYLKGGETYAVVLLSDSNEYNVWIATMGERVPETDKVVSSQPSLGNLFKSQNGETWTAEQSQDLMFKIRKAKFDINQVSYIESKILKKQEFFVGNGLTWTKKGTKQLWVYKDCNNITKKNDKVFIKSLNEKVLKSQEAIINYTNTDLIVLELLNQSSDFELDQAIETGIVIISEYSFNNFIVNSDVMNFANTNINVAYKGNGGTNFNSNLKSKDVKEFENINLGKLNILKSNLTMDDNFTLAHYFYSNNEDISPIVDLDRLSVLTVSNIINYPNEFEDKEVIDKSPNPMIKWATDDNIDMTTTGATYETKVITLENPCSMFKAFVGASVIGNADLELWYRTSNDDKKTKYIKAQPNNNFTKSGNIEEVVYDVENIEPFTKLQLKLVSKSTDMCNVPIIKDFRVIALE